MSITQSGGNTIIGALSEDIGISLKTTYKDIMGDLDNSITQFITIAGSVTKQLTGGKLGFSSQFKQQTTQMWQKTDPATINLNVEFHRVTAGQGYDGRTPGVTSQNVISVAKTLMRMALPEEDLGNTGILTPPGPSLLQGLGIEALTKAGSDGNATRDDAAVNAEMNAAKNNGKSITLQIGNLVFNHLILETAEPTFSKYTDTDGYPISCKMQLVFKSIWVATANWVGNW